MVRNSITNSCSGGFRGCAHLFFTCRYVYADIGFPLLTVGKENAPEVTAAQGEDVGSVSKEE